MQTVCCEQEERWREREKEIAAVAKDYARHEEFDFLFLSGAELHDSQVEQIWQKPSETNLRPESEKFAHTNLVSVARWHFKSEWLTHPQSDLFLYSTQTII